MVARPSECRTSSDAVGPRVVERLDLADRVSRRCRCARPCSTVRPPSRSTMTPEILPTPAYRTSFASRVEPGDRQRRPAGAPQRRMGGLDDRAGLAATASSGRRRPPPSRPPPRAARAQPVDDQDKAHAAARATPSRRRRPPRRRTRHAHGRRAPARWTSLEARIALSQTQRQSAVPVPGDGVDVELIGEAADRPQPVARRAGRRVSVGQATADVAHPGPAVQGQDFQPAPTRPQSDGPGRSSSPPAGVLDQVARRLGARSGRLGPAASRRSPAVRPTTVARRRASPTAVG